MSVYLLHFILLTAFVLLLRRKQFWGLSTLAIALLWVQLVGGGPIPSLLLGILQQHPQLRSPEWQKSNAIVLLAGGTYKRLGGDTLISHPLVLARLMEAARLYHDCKGKSTNCKVITSGGDLQGLGKSEAKVMGEELVILKVAPEDIILEEQSANTYENAKFTAPLLKHFELQALVTSGFHMTRSLLLFSHFKQRVLPAPADHLNAKYLLLPKAYNFYWTDLALHEFGGMAKFEAYDFMGWDY